MVIASLAACSVDNNAPLNSAGTAAAASQGTQPTDTLTANRSFKAPSPRVVPAVSAPKSAAASPAAPGASRGRIAFGPCQIDPRRIASRILLRAFLCVTEFLRTTGSDQRKFCTVTIALDDLA